MTTENFSALLCRGLGLLLLILGSSAILPALIFGVRSGWTTYAPMPAPGFAERLALLLRYSLPYLLQVLAGGVLLLFSRPFGRLLARGLFDYAA